MPPAVDDLIDDDHDSLTGGELIHDLTLGGVADVGGVAVEVEDIHADALGTAYHGKQREGCHKDEFLHDRGDVIW